ncbi:hypothetical protein ACFWE3_11050 [Mycobacteriaceae bacterium NPDC060252]
MSKPVGWLIAFGTFCGVFLLLGACIALFSEPTGPSESRPANRAPVPAEPSAGAPVAASPAAVGCKGAPAKIVDIINSSFTDGERLEQSQSVDGPSGTVIVGGNIVSTAGERISSHDSWLMSGGKVFGLSSDARRHTLLPDGRKVVADWTTYNDAVGACVGAQNVAG